MYILTQKLKNYTKTTLKIVLIVIIALILVYFIVISKFKPVYRVTFLGEEVGYVTNKTQFEELINDGILNPEDSSIAYVEIEELPGYHLLLADVEETDEQEIYNKVKELATVTYKSYAITVNGEVAAYVSSRDEADEAVEKLKEDYSGKLDQIDIVVKEEYTTNYSIIESEVELASAEEIVKEKVVEQQKIIGSTLDGVYFKVKPVEGVITSRYGAYDTSLRNHAHSGLDIGAPNGTDIKAAADGKVTYSGVMGGYGNLIIIDHGNNIQTYYGHCSKLYAKVGDKVEAGDVIAAVGSTGNSSGNHLHFEIRKNGSTINPQKYTYK